VLSVERRRAEGGGAKGWSQRRLGFVHRVSQREIGRQLYHLLNTLKTHARHIFQVLGVAKRAVAVARARQRGIM
jgi:ATP/maltotriose-dependent transcriptional regulator MalT